MKKIILLLVSLCVPLLVEASVNYDLEKFYVDAYIQTNGDLKVKELIVLDGTFNGYIRNLTYKNEKLKFNNPIDFSQDAIYNATNINNVSVKAQKIKLSDVSFVLFDQSGFQSLSKTFYTNDAKNGDYVESSIQNGKSYKMYFKADDEVVAFLVEYIVQDVVVLHEDVAELYWTFIGSAFEDFIGEAQIRVHLPGEGNDQFRIWTHGDLTANISFLNQSTLLTTVKKVAPHTAIDIRTTFSKDLVSNISINKKSDIAAFDKILKVEEERAETANQKREQARSIRFIVELISGFFIVLLIAWWIYVYIRFDREYKSTFVQEYNREFIDDYNVEVVDYLMNNTITQNAMSASILNLIYKKNIKVEELPEKKKKTKNYEFTLLNRDSINDTEDVLLDFLFERVGKDNKFTTEELQKYASNTKTYTVFEASYNNWLRCVRKDGERQNFYEKNGLPIISSIFILLIAVFIMFVTSYFNVDTWLSIVVLLLSIIFLVYSLLIKKRTKKGNDDYVRWKAFKKFLNDFGNFNLKELPEIALWEKYLVYATIFGLADKVEKAMSVKIKELPVGTYSGYYPMWIDYHIAHSISHSIQRSITSNQTTITNSRISNSSNSSGSGFGGGGSFGGGFGGGGGGGRGF